MNERQNETGTINNHPIQQHSTSTHRVNGLNMLVMARTSLTNSYVTAKQTNKMSKLA